MATKLIAFALVGLIGAVQYGLWFGKGSWLRVWEIDRQIAAQRRVNEGLVARNASLEAEVLDLKEGLGAIEERARNELGMIRHDEIFIQVLDRRPAAAPTGAASKAPER